MSRIRAEGNQLTEHLSILKVFGVGDRAMVV
jgi:hypothetical protein